MTGKSRAASETSQVSASDQLNRIAEFNSTAMEVFAQACRLYADGIATLNEELMGFVNARLDRDIELGRAFSECPNWSDAASLQQDWTQQATREYLAEAGRLAELASKVTQESGEPVYGRANQVLTEFSNWAATNCEDARVGLSCLRPGSPTTAV